MRSSLTRILLLALAWGICGCESPLLTGEKYSDYLRRQTQALEQAGAQRVRELDLWLKIEWVRGPYGNPTQASSFQLRVLDERGSEQNLPEQVSIVHYGWMPGMGHGTADDGVLTQIGQGLYLVDEMYFNMPGFWHIHVLLNTPEGASYEVRFPLHL